MRSRSRFFASELAHQNLEMRKHRSEVDVALKSLHEEQNASSEQKGPANKADKGTKPRIRTQIALPERLEVVLSAYCTQRGYSSSKYCECDITLCPAVSKEAIGYGTGGSRGIG